MEPINKGDETTDQIKATVELMEETAVAVFDGGIKLEDVLEGVAVAARAAAQGIDADTQEGRKEIASIAYKVARSKRMLDGAGKEVVDGWKRQAKTIDEKRKQARDFLDSLRDEIRKPVTEWEQEQERRVAEEAKREEEEAAARLAEIERREAELKAKEDAARAEEEAKLAEQEAIESANRARREAEAEVERQRQAIKDEEKRKADEEAKAEAERKRREADIEHRREINKAAVNAIVLVGASEELAKGIVAEIACGNIPSVRISY